MAEGEVKKNLIQAMVIVKRFDSKEKELVSLRVRTKQKGFSFFKMKNLSEFDGSNMDVREIVSNSDIEKLFIIKDQKLTEVTFDDFQKNFETYVGYDSFSD